jgi:transposase-like protein
VFSPEYKLAIVAEYENAPTGEKGAVLRREGLYSSHIIEWTRARDAGVLSGAVAESGVPVKRSKKSAEQVELEKLRQQNKKLQGDLAKTRMALDIMGKAHALLEELSESARTTIRRRAVPDHHRHRTTRCRDVGAAVLCADRDVTGHPVAAETSSMRFDLRLSARPTTVRASGCSTPPATVRSRSRWW